MMQEFSALITTFNALQDIAKAMLNLRDFAKINSKLIELQGAIITAQGQAIAIQQSYATLETKTRDLEAECMRLKDWSAEKQKYTIREIATGVFAYVLNEAMPDFERAHKYCCNCFERGQKSILQQSKGPQRNLDLTCQNCRGKLTFHGYINPNRPITSVL